MPDGNFEEKFNDSWRAACDVTNIDVSVGVIGVGKDGDHPIHDRWIVANKTGFRLGTSANSLGISKISEISSMEEDEVAARNDTLRDFFERRVRVWEGEKISFSLFTIN